MQPKIKFLLNLKNGMMLNLIANFTAEISFQFIQKIIISGCAHFFKTQRNPLFRQTGTDFGLV